MNLEDHIGDVIRKARLMSGVSAEAAAEAGRIRSAELAALEESGRWAAEPDWRRLAGSLGLDGGKLERLARGWSPPPLDLGAWRELRCITTAGGGMTVNCYLIWDEATREAALFDTGWEAGPVIDQVERHGLQLRFLLLTHGHEDHVAALPDLRARYPQARVRSGATAAPVDQRLRPNECLEVGNLRVTYRPTPGHAEDGVTYVVGNWPDDAPHVAVAGDAIFAGSMGRGNPSWELARQKVREQILPLPSATLICPGHGPVTTVGLERENNPFF